MRIILLVGLCVVLGLSACTSLDDAKMPGGPTEGSLDDRLLGYLDLERAKGGDGKGFVIFNVVNHRSSCGGNIRVTRADTPHQRITLDPPRVDMARSAAAVPQALRAGDYLVQSVVCTGYGAANQTFNGPHARFEVKAGEIVDIGTLEVDYKQDNLLVRTGSLHRSISASPARVTQVLKEKAPRLMAKVVNRPMILIGPPEIRVKPGG